MQSCQLRRRPFSGREESNRLIEYVNNILPGAVADRVKKTAIANAAEFAIHAINRQLPLRA